MITEEDEGDDGEVQDVEEEDEEGEMSVMSLFGLLLSPSALHNISSSIFLYRQKE